MTIEELIQTLESQKGTLRQLNGYSSFQYIKALLEDIDEQSNVVEIPQFIADWIIKSRDVYTLPQAMTCGGLAVNHWLNYEDNQRKFALAWFYGYKIKNQKQYTVKIKATKHYFAKDGNGRIYFSLKFKSEFTETELENLGLGWVFTSDGIIVAEV